MYYELYIDEFFMMNFMMDSLLLLSVRGVLRYTVPYTRILAGGALGALLTCLAVVSPFPSEVKNLLLYVVIECAMLIAGLGIRRIEEFGKALGILWISAFLMGGILQVLRPYLRMGSLFFLVAAVAYCVLTLCWKRLIRLKEKQRKICDVTLYTKNGVFDIRALLDTGNTLLDPLSQETVHVLDCREAERIFGDFPGNGFHYIPYRTVNGTGVMPAARIEQMCIHLEEGYRISAPLIGISRAKLTENGEYQMILNPDILKTGRNENDRKCSSTKTAEMEKRAGI